jgi:hypothetical protein
MFEHSERSDFSARRSLKLGIGAALAITAVISTFVVVTNPLAAVATEVATQVVTDVDLRTAAAYSSISKGALTVGADAEVDGSAVVGEGSASTAGAGSSIGAAVAGISQAQADLLTAYKDAASRTPTATMSGDLIGHTFTPGVYYSAAAISNTGTITLDALGDPEAVFIFQINAAFASAAASHVVLAGGAQALHVYWQVVGAVTIGANATFVGTLLAQGAITAGADTVISGRTLSVEGAVSLGAGMGTLGVPEIRLTNTSVRDDLVFDGETITYTFVATNSGNVALAVPPIDVSGIPGISDISYVWSGSAGTLLPKEYVTGTATYLATFDDAVNRSVTLVAGVLGTTSKNVRVLSAKAKTVIVWPIPVVDAVTVSQGVATTFDVLTNDQTVPANILSSVPERAAVVGFSRTQLTSVPRSIGGAVATVPSAPVSGAITCSETGETRGLCTYTSSDLFEGVDGFDYSVSQLGRSWNVHVTVNVTHVEVAPRAYPDLVVASRGGPDVRFAPLQNDRNDNAGTLVIISSDVPPLGQGTLTCLSSICTYAPPASGFVGTVEVNYVTANRDSNGNTGPASSGTIKIFVDAAHIAPVGFSSAPATVPTTRFGIWAETAVMDSPVATCVAGRPQVALTWRANSKATSWIIERRNLPRAVGASAGNWAAISELPGDAISFVDNRVGESQDFQWRVRPDLHRWQGVFSPASETASNPNAVNGAGC